ncbi:Gag-polypeptide of LTR copia-type [Sesbania bispinosa]|nr:Gag-polypeptide of LTR copia-type [Sesbania bispinosa]
MAASELSSAVTPECLDSTNYVEWSLNAQNKIRGRKRWGYIFGSKARPKDKKSKEYENWEDENCMVKSWLLDSMTKDIRSLFIRLATGRKSGTLSRKHIQLWQEVDAIADCTMECTKDVEKYTKMITSQRVYVFLAGLDSHLDGANRQEVMLGSMPAEGTALAIKKPFKKGVHKCTHCNGDNHVVDNCFKLHGFPDWHPKSKTTSNAKVEGLKNNSAHAAGFVAN